MSSSTNTSSLARSRSLRLPPPQTLKPPSTTIAAAAEPSYVALFLTNLRLLNLDLRVDWPDMTALTFTKDANQKQRIRCVEWSLYHLFALWDAEETHNKLQPFFPPLEPLQSLNLRAALYRCLEQAKKNGVLGRDAVLRKTMLDECKGERLEEVLAVFSNAVLKKTISQEPRAHEALVQQLATENFSYRGDKAKLSSLIWAHKASLSGYLREKQVARARYEDFSGLLDLHDRRIVRRHEQLKQLAVDSERHEMSTREIDSLQKKVHNNWTGHDMWMDTILHGDKTSNRLLETRFSSVWKHVTSGTIGDLEDGEEHVGLLEQLDRRVKTQQSRLSRWQSFGEALSLKNSLLPAKEDIPISNDEQLIDVRFMHQTVHVREDEPDDHLINSRHYQESMQLIKDLVRDLEAVDKPKGNGRETAAIALPHPNQVAPPIRDEEWSPASELEEAAGADEKPAVVRAPVPCMEHPAVEVRKPSMPSRQTSPQKVLIQPPALPTETEVAAAQILEAISLASPSPKKPRHTLSLAERTRLSMSRASHSKYSDLHDDVDDLAQLPNLSRRTSTSPTKPVVAAPEPAKQERLEGLIERTRRSMAGFEAAQKKAQVERRRSLKQGKHREMDVRKSQFSSVEEETLELSAIELLEQDGEEADYDSVFKSRPKIKTSPVVSPTREIRELEVDDY